MAYSGYTTSNYISNPSALINTLNPYSMWCWFKDSLRDSTVKSLVALSSGTGGDGPRLEVLNGAVRLTCGTGTGGRLNTSGTYSVSAWTSVGGISRSSTDRSIYLNGVKTSSVVAATLASFPVLGVGIRRGSTGSPQIPALGITIAESAFWDIDLSDAEMSSLAAGFSPLSIRPQNLRHYIPIIRDLVDTQTVAPTLTGSLSMEVHPRIYK